MVKREYKLFVTGKREGTQDFRELTLGWERLPDIKTPYWLVTGPSGIPTTLQVTPEEYESIRINDVMIVTIQSDFVMDRLPLNAD